MKPPPWPEVPSLNLPTQNYRKFFKISPYERANIFTRLFFLYTYPLFIKGARNNGLELEDVPRCPQEDEVESLTAKVTENWNSELRKENPRFWWAMLKSFGPMAMLPCLFLMINECFLVVIQPLFLGKVIRYFSHDPAIDHFTACGYAAGIVAILVTMVMLLHTIMIFMDRLAMRARSVCCTIIYLKSLKLSKSALKNTEVGQIINMMSNDVKRFDDFGFFSSYLIVAPIQMVIVVNVLWHYLNISILPGAAILLLLIPFQYVMGVFFGRVRKKASVLTDVRLQYMSEIIAGMRVLKMYTWESAFAKRVVEARAAEIAKIRISCFLKAINLSVFFVASRTILFVCFTTYVLLGNSLTSDTVFVTMAWLNQIRLTMTLFFPNAVSLAGELRVTLEKIQKFLLLDEVQSKELDNCEQPKELDDDSNNNNQPEVARKIVKIDRISASWGAQQKMPTLSDISAELGRGDLLAVVGPVGSGKSSLLMALLKELPLTSGSVQVSGRISFAGQEAWNFNDSVRANILFGEPMNYERYREVIRVCALERDLKLLTHGDLTLVGEKGVSLSGGQRARINLARAIYRDAQCYLLDDPLSALDVSVAKYIFEKCILEHLSNKVTVLVTHQVQLVERATRILVLNNGQCEAYGTYEELSKSGIDFIKLLNSEQEKSKSDSDEITRKIKEESPEYVLDPTLLHDRKSTSMWSLDTTCTESRINTPQIPILDGNFSEDSLVIPKKKGSMMSIDEVEEGSKFLALPEEHIEKGELSSQIYLEYLRAGSGIVLFTVMILSTIASQIVCQGTDIFLTLWTNDETRFGTQNQVIVIYATLIVILFVTTIVRAISFFDICMRASKNLHRNIFSRLVRTPIVFFDKNPIGRILNRFSKDLGSIDENFPYIAFDLNLVLLSAIGIVIAASYVSWYFVLPGVLFFVIIFKIRSFYIKSALDVKRFEAFARSPVFSHLSTTISGLTSIRAFGEESAFKLKFYDHINDHCSTWFLYITSSRGLGILIDWCCIFFNATIITVLMAFPENIPGGNAGLAISSGLALTGMIQWGIRQSAEFVSQMSSVERIVEYQKLEQEKTERFDERNEKIAADKSWPHKAEITFNRMCLAYSDDKLVLKNIDFKIDAGQKIGIVGRTGAGKSSIITALFRLTEPTSGSICIDGIDTQTITLECLRKKISIIPQEPVVFSGTVRFNLDPFEEYSDTAIWTALEKVQLRNAVENFNSKLQEQLNENGSNLSVGQRQLICLARAILRRNRILVLDEATANVDPATDQTIQKNIREEFKHCTVLTIAHRLTTIIDYDRILVLDAGEVKEYDTPHQLFNNKRGLFYEMCKNTGPDMFESLQQSVNRAYNNQF